MQYWLLKDFKIGSYNNNIEKAFNKGFKISIFSDTTSLPILFCLLFHLAAFVHHSLSALWKKDPAWHQNTGLVKVEKNAEGSEY